MRWWRLLRRGLGGLGGGDTNLASEKGWREGEIKGLVVKCLPACLRSYR